MPGANLRKFAAKMGGYGGQLNVAWAAGAAANSNITITGIKPGDEIVAAIHLREGATAGTPIKTNLISEMKITANDTVQCTTTATNGSNEQVLVIWVTHPRKKKL